MTAAPSMVAIEMARESTALSRGFQATTSTQQPLRSPTPSLPQVAWIHLKPTPCPVVLRDDGLLTAQEVICLDLLDVGWVVLGTCGSGLGRLVRGEGLFRLRRAFEIAGARTVVMALWRIDDLGTQEFMKQVYQYRLAGRSTVDAVRMAQLERLGHARRHLNRIHPTSWGSIVAQGDWR